MIFFSRAYLNSNMQATTPGGSANLCCQDVLVFCTNLSTQTPAKKERKKKKERNLGKHGQENIFHLFHSQASFLHKELAYCYTAGLLDTEEEGHPNLSG
jgi:hypothetical protein